MEYMTNEQKQQDEYVFCQTCFVNALKTCALRRCRFFSAVIQSVNKMLFMRNIEAISSANFTFLNPLIYTVNKKFCQVPQTIVLTNFVLSVMI